MPPWLGVRIWSINHRDGVDFDQVVGGQALHAKYHISWLVVSEQFYPSCFDDRQAFVAVVVDDIDRDPGDLRRRRAGSGKCSAEIGKYLACLSCKVTTANKLTLQVFGLLARDEYPFAACRNDDLAVCLGDGKILGIDALEGHVSGLLYGDFSNRFHLKVW